MQVLHGVQVGGGAVTIPAIAEGLFASSRIAVLIISVRSIRWPRWAAGLFSRIAPLTKKRFQGEDGSKQRKQRLSTKYS